MRSLAVCVQGADWELREGLKGSKAVRAAALQCLTLLVQAVGTADALAFFLPGIATGLAKALVAAGSSQGARAQTGAGASSAATVAALEGLAAVLSITLGTDTEVEGGSLDAQQGTGSGAAAAALDKLLYLSEKSKAADSKDGAAPPEANPALEKAAPASSQGPSDLRVHRTAEWVQTAGKNIHPLLATSLPQLCQYPRQAVREGLARGEEVFPCFMP